MYTHRFSKIPSMVVPIKILVWIPGVLTRDRELRVITCSIRFIIGFIIFRNQIVLLSRSNSFCFGLWWWTRFPISNPSTWTRERQLVVIQTRAPEFNLQFRDWIVMILAAEIFLNDVPRDLATIETIVGYQQAKNAGCCWTTCRSPCWW